MILSSHFGRLASRGRQWISRDFSRNLQMFLNFLVSIYTYIYIYFFPGTTQSSAKCQKNAKIEWFRCLREPILLRFHTHFRCRSAAAEGSRGDTSRNTKTAGMTKKIEQTLCNKKIHPKKSVHHQKTTVLRQLRALPALAAAFRSNWEHLRRWTLTAPSLGLQLQMFLKHRGRELVLRPCCLWRLRVKFSFYQFSGYCQRVPYKLVNDKGRRTRTPLPLKSTAPAMLALDTKAGRAKRVTKSAEILLFGLKNITQVWKRPMRLISRYLAFLHRTKTTHLHRGVAGAARP